MKKIIALGLSAILLIGIMDGCSKEKDIPTTSCTTETYDIPIITEAETTAVTEVDETTEPNEPTETQPVTMCETPEDLEKILGYTLEVPELEGYRIDYMVVNKRPRLHARYTKDGFDIYGNPTIVETANVFKFKNLPNPGESVAPFIFYISEDDVVETKEINGLTVTIKYFEDLIDQVSWVNGEFGYVIYPAGSTLSNEQVLQLVDKIK